MEITPHNLHPLTDLLAPSRRSFWGVLREIWVDELEEERSELSSTKGWLPSMPCLTQVGHWRVAELEHPAVVHSWTGPFVVEAIALV